MAAASSPNPQIISESKSAKKKKSKAEAAAKESNAQFDSEAANGHGPNDPVLNGADGTYESPYLKELYKNIRNVKKKLNATQKVDSIIAENPGLSLEELLSSRKINQDQKVQAQKKPSLQATLAQLEEQAAQYKQFDEEYQKRISTERSALEASHKDDLEKVKAAAISEANIEAAKEAKENLLALSKFLRAAAAKRQAGDETSAENRAFEGALLLIYGGETSAVVAMEKLISGSEEKVPTVDQVPSEYTYKQVKESAFEYAPYAAEEAWAEEVAQSEPAPPTTEEPSTLVDTDPTVAHAGLTEIDANPEPITNGLSHLDTPTVPDASSVDTGAANAAAEANWEAKLSTSVESGPEEWVEIARDPAETDTGTAATPAAMVGTQSWAEDVPAEVTSSIAEPVPQLANNGDGFHEVHHGRGRDRNGPQSEYRGGGRGGRGFRGDRGNDSGYRGRGGFRGDRSGGEGGYRGRVRGGFRGNRGRGEGS